MLYTIISDEDRWRDALRTMGVFAVRTELQRRSGSPSDTVYDIVHTAPYPTREFCMRWCCEEENKLPNLSSWFIGIFCTLLVMLFCIIRLAANLNAPVPHRAGENAAGPIASASPIDNQGLAPGGMNSSAGYSAPQSSFSSQAYNMGQVPGCAYTSFANARCPGNPGSPTSITHPGGGGSGPSSNAYAGPAASTTH